MIGPEDLSRVSGPAYMVVGDFGFKSGSKNMDSRGQINTVVYSDSCSGITIPAFFKVCCWSLHVGTLISCTKPLHCSCIIMRLSLGWWAGGGGGKSIRIRIGDIVSGPKKRQNIVLEVLLEHVYAVLEVFWGHVYTALDIVLGHVYTVLEVFWGLVYIVLEVFLRLFDTVLELFSDTF